jgi:hypothetical protein
MSLDLIFTICEFDVSHAIFFFGPALLLQILGIPMGSPLSPQLAIITCAYAEHLWISSHQLWVSHLAAVRYVDDLGAIVAFDARSLRSFNRALRLLAQIVHNCYPQGLLLKYTLSLSELTLMRCRFSVSLTRDLQFTYVNKNQDLSTGQTFRRHRHYLSFFPRPMLFNTATATLPTISGFSSSPDSACLSSIDLLLELQTLDYPSRLLQTILHRLASADRSSTLWPRLLLLLE